MYPKLLFYTLLKIKVYGKENLSKIINQGVKEPNSVKKLSINSSFISYNRKLNYFF